jgi:formyltetrahydrofolate deformylase
MNKYILTLSCTDRLGVVARVTSFLSKHGCFIIESSQYGDPHTKKFFLRCLFTTENESIAFEEVKRNFFVVANEFSMDWNLVDTNYKHRVLIMVSKTGHCLNAILNRSAMGALPIDVVGVVSNHRSQEEMCSWYKIPFYYYPLTHDSKEEQENKVLNLVSKHDIDLVILSRYMQILSPTLTRPLQGKAINIHHSFLPSFKGARPYHQAHERGVKLIGATAHYVSSELDEGPIIEQEVMRVDHNAQPEDLVAIGRDIESLVLLRAIKYHIEHRILLNEHKTVIFT